MKEHERKALTARVAEDLAQHQYIQLVNENGVEVWRCARPGSSCYGFDICVTRFGMSMMGDIGPLVFHVGASYGINFLRHQSDPAPCRSPVIPHINESRQPPAPYRLPFVSGIKLPKKKTVAGPMSQAVVVPRLKNGTAIAIANSPMPAHNRLRGVNHSRNASSFLPAITTSLFDKQQSISPT